MMNLFQDYGEEVLGEGLTSPHRKNSARYEMLQGTRN
jgi:hypothetical protein